MTQTVGDLVAGMIEGTYARIVADSVHAGHRVTTYEAQMHRFVLAEFNTHRVFSRNSASSRAIPLAKQIDRVGNNPALPVVWAAEQKGMQGGDEVNPEAARVAEQAWLAARVHAVNYAQTLGELGIHKSIANRLLEPFMWHKVIVTATAWKNWFALRDNPLAQPEIQRVAACMAEVYADSTPTELLRGQWHMPFVDEQDRLATANLPTSVGPAQSVLVKVSTSRVARVSLLTHDGQRALLEDTGLYDKLTSADPMHASPLEHVATPNPDNVHEVEVRRHLMMDGVHPSRMTLTLPKYGNLIGWHQHRFDVEIDKQYQAFA